MEVMAVADQRSIHMYVHHSRQRCCSPKVVMGFLDGVLSGLGAGLLLAPRDQVEYGVDEAAALSCHSIPVGSQGSGIMLTVLRHTQSWLRLAGTWGQQHGTWFHKGTMKLPPQALAAAAAVPAACTLACWGSDQGTAMLESYAAGTGQQHCRKLALGSLLMYARHTSPPSS